MTALPRDQRDAAVAVCLAEAVRQGQVHPVDAVRVIKHEMRRRNTNRTASLPYRSRAAQEVIERYHGRAEAVPKNGSVDALHADHVYEFSAEDLRATVTQHDWEQLLDRARTVVAVTAKENYQLEQLERAGVRGPAKYAQCGIQWAGEPPPFVTTGKN